MKESMLDMRPKEEIITFHGHFSKDTIDHLLTLPYEFEIKIKNTKKKA